MRFRFEVVIECCDDETAEKLESVLLPDNRSFPRDQTFTSDRRGSTLALGVETARLMSGLSSISSILADAGLFEQISSSTASYLRASSSQ